MGLRAVALTLAPLAAGLLLSAKGLRPPPCLSTVSLHLLVLLAGFEIGYSLPSRLAEMRRSVAAGALLAASTLAGGLLAGLALAPAARLEPCVSAAVAAAGGWYTLAAPVLAPHGPRAALLALLANMAREQLHIALYPVLASRGLRLEAAALGGATTMDTGLPVVLLSGGGEAAAAAVVQGVALTALLPALLPPLAGLC